MKPCSSAKVTVLFILFCSNSLRADWLWDNDLAVATPTARGYKAHFTFLNKGKTSVTVIGLTFSCPCVVYHYETTTAQPGQTGSLTITIENPEARPPGEDWDLIASGSAATQPRELTIRLEKSNTEK
jgi:hypothetical protein